MLDAYYHWRETQGILDDIAAGIPAPPIYPVGNTIGWTFPIYYQACLNTFVGTSRTGYPALTPAQQQDILDDFADAYQTMDSNGSIPEYPRGTGNEFQDFVNGATWYASVLPWFKQLGEILGIPVNQITPGFTDPSESPLTIPNTHSSGFPASLTEPFPGILFASYVFEVSLPTPVITTIEAGVTAVGRYNIEIWDASTSPRTQVTDTLWPVRIRLPLPAGYTTQAKCNNLRVYHIDALGFPEIRPILNAGTSAADGYIEFYSQFFSPFVLGEAEHEHSYSAWNVRTPATSDAAGEEFRACLCGHEETRAIAKLPWWAKLPAFVQWILRWLCFGFIWMK